MIRTIRPVVCDYGIFEDGKLKIVCNSSTNAKLIKEILDKDEMCNRADYVFTAHDFNTFLNEIHSNQLHLEVANRDECEGNATIKDNAEALAESMYSLICDKYGSSANEFARHFVNKISQLRAE